MTQTPIYLVEDSGLKKMNPARPEKELDPQDLIEAHPELIGDGKRPSRPRSIFCWTFAFVFDPAT